MLNNEKTLRSYNVSMNRNAQDLMMNAPSAMFDQLKDLNIVHKKRSFFYF